MKSSEYILTYNGIEPYTGQHTLSWTRVEYEIGTINDPHGTTVVSPTAGINGTVVTLSNTADSGYLLSGYSITGAELTGNQFTLSGHDVNIDVSYSRIYNITTGVSGSGTMAASPMSGIDNTVVTLSNTPDTGYLFDHYALTGATLSDSSHFSIDGSDVNVVCHFKPDYNPYDLPSSTMRVRATAALSSTDTTKCSIVRVDGTDDIYDITMHNLSSWGVANGGGTITGHTKITDILGANIVGATSLCIASAKWVNLTAIEPFDASTIQKMSFSESYIQQVPRLNTESLTDATDLFYGCVDLTGGLSNMDLSHVVDASRMCEACYDLTGTDYLYMPAVTSCFEAFDRCYSLSSVNVYMPNATNLGYMFYECRALSSEPVLTIGTPTALYGMFSKCRSLTSVPLFNMESATSIVGMIDRCSALKSIPAYQPKVVARAGSFAQNCVNVRHGSLNMYNQLTAQSVPPSSHSGTFTNCGINNTAGAAELAQIPTSWGGTKA